MNIKQITILLIAVIYLQACRKVDKQETATVENRIEKKLPFEIDQPLKYENFDSLFQKEKIIKLETNKNSLISSISKIEYYNNKIYVIDHYNEYSVTCFDQNGRFKFKLKKIGRGPDEYIRFEDANINTDSGDIELLNGKKLMVYDSLGNFKKAIQLPYYAGSFCSLPGIRFFYKNFTIEQQGQTGSFRLYSINSKGVIKKYLKFNSNGKGDALIGENNFTRVNNKEYRFHERYNDTIYKITPQGISSFYQIAFLNYENKKPEDFLTNQEKYSNKREFAKKMSIPRIADFYEFDNTIMGFYDKYIHGTEGIFPFVFDKRSNKLVQNQHRRSNLGLELYLIMPDFNIGQKPCAHITPSTIYKFIEEQKDPEYKKRIKAYFEYDDNINANPYIIVYKPITINEK